MSSGTTLMIQSFDNFVQHNYKKLYTHALCTAKNQEDAHDLLMDVYIKIKQRVIASGYSTNQFITYFCTSISNTFSANRKAKKNRIPYVQVEECYEDLEKMNCDDISWQEDEEYHQQRELLTKEIFQFLDGRYDERQIFVFTVYYLMTEHRMTYQEISNQTGLSITYCSKTIQAIKADIRKNLFKFIKDNDTRRITRIKEIM